MFFNNNLKGNLNNNLNENQNSNQSQKINNNFGNTIDIGYLNNFDPNNNQALNNNYNNFQNFQPNNNLEMNNNNYQPNFNLGNYDSNFNINQLPNGNPGNSFNNTINSSPSKNPLNNTINLRGTGNLNISNQSDIDGVIKKNFLEGIKQQILSNKNSKINELMKRKMEDQKYLSDMNTYNPFGKVGAGAPLRDNSGNIITKRRALISDNKKLNDSNGNIKDEASNPNLQLNNIISNLTQRISAYGNENLSGINIPRYSSAKVVVN